MERPGFNPEEERPQIEERWEGENLILSAQKEPGVSLIIEKYFLDAGEVNKKETTLTVNAYKATYNFQIRETDHNVEVVIPKKESYWVMRWADAIREETDPNWRPWKD